PGFGCLIAYSPDGKRLATGSVGSDSAPNGQIQLWEADTGRLLDIAPLPAPVSTTSSRDAEKPSAVPDYNAVPSPVSIAFSRDGRWFAVGTADGNVWLWEAANLRMEPKRLKADSSELYGLVFSADSQRLFTSGVDQVVRVWDLATLQQLRLLQGHASVMWSLAVAPDGRRIEDERGKQ